jgi:acetyltransferase-like isoleucine patch superfamily enzyme
VLERAVFLKIVSESASVRMGDMVFMGYNSELDISDQLWVGHKVLIGPGCFVTDHDHRHEFGRFIADQGCNSAPVRLEDDVWLGARVVILPGVVMGAGSVAAAGAVVTRNVEPMTIVAGTPARKVGKWTPQCP